MLYILFNTIILYYFIKLFNNNLEFRLKIITFFLIIVLLDKIILLNNIIKLYGDC